MDYTFIAKQKLQEKGVEYTEPYHLNIVGFRDSNKVNTFNDVLVYWYYDNNRVCFIKQVDKFTTDPGYKSLKEPVNKKGCAILKSGYYPKMWQRGMHKGQYPALTQYGPCSVYRDNDKDLVLDFIEASVETGVFGINLHRANPSLESTQVENWSAGCQVFANPIQFKAFMSAVDTCVEKGKQKYFDYLLLNIKTDLL